METVENVVFVVVDSGKRGKIKQTHDALSFYRTFVNNAEFNLVSHSSQLQHLKVCSQVPSTINATSPR